MGSVLILRPGMLTTVQDSGRWGLQARGVPVAGPMDPISHRLANRLAGNDERAATLEVTLLGPEIEVEGEGRFAVTGAEFELSVDGRAAPLHEIICAGNGQRIRFGSLRRGARAYMAVTGGFDVPPTFGSRATHVISRMGGLGGRPLIAGDRIPIGNLTAGISKPRAPTPIVSLPEHGAKIRVMLGPQDDYFTPAAVVTLCTARYIISPNSDRMGYRLEGPPLEHARGADIISDATPLGVLQVPASGQPILLLADRQTTGGYPKIATVITADLPIAGQLAPGDWIDFRVCSRGEAMAALIAQERMLLR